MINKIAEILQELIREENTTNAKVAKAIGVDKSLISYWVKGKSQPTADNIIKLCEYFNVSADYLLGRTDY